ncbi:hypothetical protein [Edaphobacter sp.]|uniref:hypothetical protein n=1 Tax=Edaphobacter sp. TaxID=1934404 RepID=UPI002DBD0D04|nr:hypothetical protein [Edaphobacter sp.]HEU5342457.1 hypothetical protein [Edaphobacter sp.]
MSNDGVYAAEMWIIGFGHGKGGVADARPGRRTMAWRVGLSLPRHRQVVFDMGAIPNLLNC